MRARQNCAFGKGRQRQCPLSASPQSALTLAGWAGISFDTIAKSGEAPFFTKRNKSLPEVTDTATDEKSKPFPAPCLEPDLSPGRSLILV